MISHVLLIILVSALSMVIANSYFTVAQKCETQCEFGKISIFSDIFTGKGNNSKTLNQFDPLNIRDIHR
ncbi:MAG: hypothetical protein M3O68_09185 [Thermoproteota archaeon]|nr:hypothetical protein [Thermoproteota archaeon]